MCRFIAYSGSSILLSDLLIKPENSLIKQSYQARESAEPLNGDGFGLGWYTHEIEPSPGLFKSIQPAWNNQNLLHLATKIRSSCFFAHVRAATAGGVAEDNCHPFYYNNLLFMHNGEIGNFHRLKRYIRRSLGDNIYDWIKGQTDSEHLFAMILQTHIHQKRHHSLDEYAQSITETIAQVNQLHQQYKGDEPSFLNIVLSDGKWIIATRYVSNSELTPRSLYYSAGSELEHVEGSYRIHPSSKNKAVLIVSERLNASKSGWHVVPSNHMVLLDEQLTINLRQI